MANKRTKIENAPVKYRNFAGVKTQYNREGDSNFVIILDEEVAKNMMDDVDEQGIGWYIKPVEFDTGKIEYQLKLRLGDGRYKDPDVFVVGEDGRPIPFNRGQWPRLDKSTITISFVDVVFHQSRKTFEYQGKEYYSAYVDEVFVNIVESDLRRKYGVGADDNLPELDD